MRHHLTLTFSSLLSLLFFTFHHADDIRREMAPGGLINLVVVVFLVVWLYGTLVLAERRSGFIIVLLFSLLGLFIPVVHMKGSGLVGGRIANSSGDLFFVWTLIALGITSLFSAILSVRGLWSLRRGQTQ